MLLLYTDGLKCPPKVNFHYEYTLYKYIPPSPLSIHLEDLYLLYKPPPPKVFNNENILSVKF